MKNNSAERITTTYTTTTVTRRLSVPAEQKRGTILPFTRRPASAPSRARDLAERLRYRLSELEVFMGIEKCAFRGSALQRRRDAAIAIETLSQLGRDLVDRILSGRPDSLGTAILVRDLTEAIHTVALERLDSDSKLCDAASEAAHLGRGIVNRLERVAA